MNCKIATKKRLYSLIYRDHATKRKGLCVVPKWARTRSLEVGPREGQRRRLVNHSHFSLTLTHRALPINSCDFELSPLLTPTYFQIELGQRIRGQKVLNPDTH